MSRKGWASVDEWIDATPENKLELIDGRLVVCSLEGSRRIAWELLQDYGPPLGLEHAPASLWWQALAEAYRPSPLPTTPGGWWRWTQEVEHNPGPAPAGPLVTGEHRR